MIENLPIKIGAYTARLYRLMASSLDRAFKEKGIPISLEQFKIMMMLENCGERSLTEIAEVVDRDNAAISRSVKSLEDKGYVLRESDHIDKRFKKLVITNEGKMILSHIMEIEQAKVAEVISDFTAAETAQFEFLLKKASNNLLNPCKIEMNEN